MADRNTYVNAAPTIARTLHRAMQVFAHAPCLGTPVVVRDDASRDVAGASGAGGAGAGADESKSGPASTTERAVDAAMARLGKGKPRIEYEWLTFKQVGRLSRLLAAGLQAALPPRKVVGICGPNRKEWIVSDFACCFADYVTVGLHTSWPEHEMRSILSGARVDMVICAGNLVPRFLAAAKDTGVGVIVSMDEVDEQAAAAAAAGVRLLSYQALIDGAAAACGDGEPPAPYMNVSSEPAGDMYTLIYASGTSGVPKATMTTKSRWKKDIGAGLWRLQHKVALSYSALAHGMDRGIVWQMAILGGRIGFAHEEHFFESLRAVQPSQLVAMPHIWNILYADFNNALHDALREHTRFMLQDFAASLGIANPATDERVGAALTKPDWVGLLADRLAATGTTGLNATVAAQLKASMTRRFARWALGTRLECVCTGGAHTSKEVFEFMQSLVPDSTFPAVDSYGTTEVPGIANNGTISEDIDVKLVDVPEMGYLSTDKPWPRGEIWARSKTNMTPGYWNAPDITADSFEDGWFKTGDVGEIDGQGKLRIIDRKKNLEELYVNGRSVWITPGPIESLMAEVDKISQVCIRGDRELGWLVALVVLNPEYVKAWAAAQSPPASRADILLDPSVKVQLLLDMKRVAVEHGLKDYEHIKGAVLQIDPWTPDNGLLTSTGKPRRSFLDKRFKQALLDELTRLERESERRRIDFSKDYLTYTFEAPTPEGTARVNEAWEAAKPIILEQRAHIAAGEHKAKLRARVEALRTEFKAREDAVRAEVQASVDAVVAAAAAEPADEATLREGVVQFLDSMGTLRNAVKELKICEQAIIGEPDEEFQRIDQRREAAMARVEEVAREVGEEVPRVLMSSAVLVDPSAERPNAMSEMAALDSWVVSCVLCGEEIEAGARGQGTLRYHCQDMDRTDIDERCYKQFTAVRKALECPAGAAALSTLRNYSEAPFTLTSVEFQNQVWSRLQVKELVPWKKDEATHTVDTSHVSDAWMAKLKRCFWRAGQDERNAKFLADGSYDEMVNPPATGTPARLISEAFKVFANRLCLGAPKPGLLGADVAMPTSKLVQTVEGGFTEHDDYLWLTYEQVGELATRVAKGLKKTLRPNAHVGVCGFNSFEWSLCDFADAMAGNVTVGLHTTYSVAEMAAVISHSDVELIFVSSRCLGLIDAALTQVANDADKTMRVANVVVLDGDHAASGEDESKGSEGTGAGAGAGAGAAPPVSVSVEGVAVQYLTQFATDEGELDDPLCLPHGGGEQLFTLLYTSGATGTPKAVQATAAQFWVDVSESVFASPLIGVSFIPLSHSSDRLRVWEFLGNGGRVGYAFYDASNWAAHEHTKKDVTVESFGMDNNVAGLMRQIKPLSPTALAFPPRIWNGLYYLFQQALTDAGYYEVEEAQRSAVWERVRTDFVPILGRRVAFIATGGAPTPPVVAAWVERVWQGHHLVNSYGATECGGITSDGKPMKKESWQLPVEIKLLDHPDSGFRTTDKPHARGEVLVRSILLTPGYYKNPELTAASFDEEGFFHTGDLASRDDRGRYQVLGRVKSTRALAGGNVIVPDHVENVFQASSFVRQVFVHTSGQRPAPVVVVVVDDTNVLKWFHDDGRPVDGGKLSNSTVKDRKLVATVRADFIRLAEEAALPPFTHPSGVHLTTEEWNPANGLLNLHWKKARHNIEAKYRQTLDALLSL